MFWMFDPVSLILLAPALILSVYASYKVRATYAKYLQVPTQRRITASQAVQRILGTAGVSVGTGSPSSWSVRMERIAQPLGDHYDPRSRTLRLSAPESTSIAAVGVAAHEAGHALQHAQGYAPLALRSAIVPVAQFGSWLAFPLFFFGLIFQAEFLITAGILLFSAAVLFTLVTLPVEFNASRRAVTALNDGGLVTREELGAVKEVLTAAALTYVAAAAMAILQLVRLLLIANSARRR